MRFTSDIGQQLVLALDATAVALHYHLPRTVAHTALQRQSRA
jgi:hypothetical protein